MKNIESPNTSGQKRTYEAPSLVPAGNIRDLTLGFHHGNFLDAAFPPHTPKGKLTFS